MKKVICLLVVSIQVLVAQTPTDANLMQAKQACVLLDYNYGDFNQYWEGALKRENQTIATVQRQSILPMVAFGITDDLNIYAGVPLIKTNSTEPNGGKFAGVSGIQDLSLAVKYRWLNKKLDHGQFAALATLGFSTPVSNYLSDYLPYSIGFGAPEWSYRLIVQYDTDTDWYARGAGSFLWRGYTEAERAYYYNNGSYYTPWMDVPNGITAEVVAGKWLSNKSLQLEASFWSLHSLSGDDIRAYNAAQPTNRMHSSRVGALARYYLKSVNGLGLVAYHTRVVAGRNAPVMRSTGFGVTYFFNYRKN